MLHLATFLPDGRRAAVTTTCRDTGHGEHGGGVVERGHGELQRRPRPGAPGGSQGVGLWGGGKDDLGQALGATASAPAARLPTIPRRKLRSTAPASTPLNRPSCVLSSSLRKMGKRGKRGERGWRAHLGSWEREGGMGLQRPANQWHLRRRQP